MLTVGKNIGLISSRLWSEVQEIVDTVSDSLNFPTLFLDCLYHVSFWWYSPLNLPLSCELEKRHNRWFWGPQFLGEGYPKFWTHIFKSHSLLNVWQVWGEFRSLGSESSGRKYKEDRITVKPKSADDNVDSGGLYADYVLVWLSCPTLNWVSTGMGDRLPL